MKLLFIGDIIGKPGRDIVKKHLQNIKEEFHIDFTIANCENLAHGFGITLKTVEEMISCGIDVITGGNHSWDKKEANSLYETHPIIRPINFPDGVPGRGTIIVHKGEEKLAVINLLGHFGMGMVENPFNIIENEVNRLKSDGVQNIFIDFHAEATSEKNALLHLLEGKVSFIAGTHTHIGTDDLLIKNNTGYVTDVGLTGCMDGVIGMDKEAPIYRFKTGLKKNYDIPKNCKKIFQSIIIDMEDGKCIEAKKIKVYDDGEVKISMNAYRL